MSLRHRRIALVEDDPIMGESLQQRLALEGANVNWWRSGEEAIAGLASLRPDAVICDIRLPDRNGEEVFRLACGNANVPAFLFITAYADIDQAVRLMRYGAGDYLTKPFEMGELLSRLQQLVRPLEGEVEPAFGVSPASQSVETLIRKLGKVQSSVLITGETGSGKEVCAKLLHLQAAQSGPFMAVNCAAIPTDLMESELFGHEKGAFTGAHGRHIGYAERAGTGTLFLDEIADLPLKLQAKLLRLLEDRRFHRIGGESAVPFRARLICATNADLTEKVRRGEFREDLFYRINVVSLPVPPLRERAEDIPWLIDRLFRELSALIGSEVTGVSVLAVEAALEHRWPGNVRELRNRMERAIALSPGPWIMPADMFPDVFRPVAMPTDSGQDSLATARDAAERRQIERVLTETGGQIAETARRLGIARTTLWEKMRRFGLTERS